MRNSTIDALISCISVKTRRNAHTNLRAHGFIPLTLVR